MSYPRRRWWVWKSQITWNEQTLEKWLTDPDAYVVGNNMGFHVANPQERRDLIRYLKEGTGNRSSPGGL